MISRGELGALLLRMRMRKGLTQTQLAEKAGISVYAICAYEKGKNSPSIESLQLVLDALGYMIDIRRDIDE